MKPIVIFNPDNISIEENVVYKYRAATRGVVFDNESKIASLFEDKIYYSLPGGEEKEGEQSVESFIRECKEELGCNITDIKHLGTTIEFYDGWLNLTNIFSAKVDGEKMKIEFMGDEDSDEKACIVDWIGFDELQDTILSMIENGKEEKRFRYKRDLSILKMKESLDT